MAERICDLRSALEVLECSGHSISAIDVSIDPDLEIINDYLASYSSPSALWMTADQPLRLYRNPTTGKFPVLLGVFGSRERTRLLLDPAGRESHEVSNAALVTRAIMNPIRPVVLERGTDRIVIEQPNLRAELPILTYSFGDPGPTITMGLVYAHDATSGLSNCSVHRITVKESSLVIGTSPTGHLQRMIDACVARNERLTISINIGLDPAVYLASTLSKPAVDFGDDELGVAGAIRGRAVELAPCFSNDGFFVNHAEIVIEGTLGEEREPEAEVSVANPHVNGQSMPEYLGYYSPCGSIPAMQVSAMSYRPGAVYQTVSGPGREQSELLGAGQEVAIYRVLDGIGLSGVVREIVAQPAAGGHLFTVLQVAKRSSDDDALLRRASVKVLQEVSTTKNLMLIDEDVNPYATDDLLWALSTRFRADMDLLVTGPLRGTVLDPTQSERYAPEVPNGFVGKSVFDCTVPYELRQRFKRAFN